MAGVENSNLKEHILNTGDNVALRLPFNNWGLSQLEFAWTKVKHFIRANNVRTELSLNHSFVMKKHITERMTSFLNL
jgi:hypothetical protein